MRLWIARKLLTPLLTVKLFFMADGKVLDDWADVAKSIFEVEEDDAMWKHLLRFEDSKFKASKWGLGEWDYELLEDAPLDVVVGEENWANFLKAENLSAVEYNWGTDVMLCTRTLDFDDVEETVGKWTGKVFSLKFSWDVKRAGTWNLSLSRKLLMSDQEEVRTLCRAIKLADNYNLHELVEKQDKKHDATAASKDGFEWELEPIIEGQVLEVSPMQPSKFGGSKTSVADLASHCSSPSLKENTAGMLRCRDMSGYSLSLSIDPEWLDRMSDDSSSHHPQIIGLQSAKGSVSNMDVGSEISGLELNVPVTYGWDGEFEMAGFEEDEDGNIVQKSTNSKDIDMTSPNKAGRKSLVKELNTVAKSEVKWAEDWEHLQADEWWLKKWEREEENELFRLILFQMDEVELNLLYTDCPLNNTNLIPAYDKILKQSRYDWTAVHVQQQVDEYSQTDEEHNHNPNANRAPAPVPGGVITNHGRVDWVAIQPQQVSMLPESPPRERGNQNLPLGPVVDQRAHWAAGGIGYRQAGTPNPFQQDALGVLSPPAWAWTGLETTAGQGGFSSSDGSSIELRFANFKNVKAQEEGAASVKKSDWAMGADYNKAKYGVWAEHEEHVKEVFQTNLDAVKTNPFRVLNAIVRHSYEHESESEEQWEETISAESEMVKFLREHNEGCSLLLKCLYNNMVTRAEILLEDPRFVQVNATDMIFGRTALHVWARYGHETIVYKLLCHPLIDVSVLGKCQETPLHLWLFHDEDDIAQRLINFAESSIYDNIYMGLQEIENNQSALATVTRGTSLDLYFRLLGDINRQTAGTGEPWSSGMLADAQAAVMRGVNHARALSLGQKSHVSDGGVGASGETIDNVWLWVAMWVDEITQYIESSKPATEVGAAQSWAKWDTGKLLKFLNGWDERGFTWLHFAIYKDKLALVKQVLSCPFYYIINCRDDRGKSAMHVAGLWAGEDTVWFVLERLANKRMDLDAGWSWLAINTDVHGTPDTNDSSSFIRISEEPGHWKSKEHLANSRMLGGGVDWNPYRVHVEKLESIRGNSAAYFKNYAHATYTALAVAWEREDMWLRIQGLASTQAQRQRNRRRLTPKMSTTDPTMNISASLTMSANNSFSPNKRSLKRHESQPDVGLPALPTGQSVPSVWVAGTGGDITASTNSPSLIANAPKWYSTWQYGEVCRAVEWSREEIEGLRAYSDYPLVKRFSVPESIAALRNEANNPAPTSYSFGLGHLTGSGAVYGWDGRRKAPKFLEEYGLQATVLNPALKDKMGNTWIDYMFRNTKISQSRMQDILGALKLQQR